MLDISDIHRALHTARLKAKLTQRDVAERAGTSQSAIAAIERGDTNPTIDTLARYASAAGVSLRVTLEPLHMPDPIVERYKRDVDRTLLRDNLRKSVDERLRLLSQWQRAGRELQTATTRAKHVTKKSTVRGR